MKGMDQYSQELVVIRKSWTHFIGGYYSDTDKFLKEAAKHGISRRAPAQVVRGMQFGDRIIFLRYAKNASFAFAEGVITGITLDHEIAEIVGNQLKERGLAEYQDAPGGGSMIERECGSFMICGGWVVKASLSDCMELAIEAAEARNEKLSVMVWARLTQQYPAPTILQPSPKFSRSFGRVPDDTAILPEDLAQQERNVFEIRNYNKKVRPARLPAKVSA